MNSIAPWWLFWTVCFVLAVSSFAVIAAVVLVRGFHDLKEMIRILTEKKRA